jgi:S1-C subfamily serine protease
LRQLYKWGDEHVWITKNYVDDKQEIHDGVNDTYVGGGHGSGVWIDDTTMVTACHVADEDDELYAFDLEGKNARFVVGVCDKDRDFAVLSRISNGAGGHRPEHIQFAPLPPRGTSVYVIGFPADNRLTVTGGHFVGAPRGVYGEDPKEGMYAITSEAYGGNSGGAVVILEDGVVKLIGILTAGYPTGDHTFMRDLSAYIDWLER